jgi:tetratricopeptide (TPR) repeat protein
MSSVRHAAPLLAPVAALCLFAAVLPVALPLPRSGPSSETCLTLADAPPAGPDALPALERCSAISPNDAELLEDLGAAYEAAKAPARAETAYRQALALDPDAARVRARLARLALARGDREDARREAEAALRLQPNRRALLDLLGAIDAASGAAHP